MKHQFQSSAERGQGLVEYALILSLIAIAAVVGLGVVGKSVQSAYCSVVTGLQSDAPLCAADGGNQNQGNQSQGNQEQGNQGHEGDQCQVHKSNQGQPAYYLFTMRNGEWRYENQAQVSFHVTKCPDGTME